MKWMVSSFIVLIALAAVLLVAPSFVDWNKYKGQAIEQVEAQTGLNVEIGGDISLAILPSPRVYIEKVMVSDPTDAKGPLAALERLDVHVGLMELLQKKVSVTSINLETPIIVLKKDAAGKFNFMTPQIEALMEKKDPAPKKAEGQQFQVAFSNVEISDGSFSYKDAAAGSAITLTQMNLSLDADGFEGPFEADGSLLYDGKAVKLSAKTGKIENNATSVNAKGSIAGADFQYAGVAAWGEEPGAQGQISLGVSSLPQFFEDMGAGAAPLQGALKFDGFLNATDKVVSVKDATLSIADQVLKGSAMVELEPLTIKAAMASDQPLNLDKILGAPKAGKDAKGVDLGAMLPETLELPAISALDIQFKAPAMIYNGAASKGLTAVIGHAGKTFDVRVNVNETPGKAVIEAVGALEFAEKSTSSKTGKDIYSGSSASFTVKGQVQNTPEMIRSFTGLSGLPLISTSKVGLFDLKGRLNRAGLTIDDSVVNLDDLKASVSGSLKAQKETSRQMLSVKAVVSALDLDALMGGEKAAPAAGGDPLAGLKALALPFDLDSSVTINSAKFQGRDVKGLKLAAQIYPNSIVFENVGASDFAGASGKVSGKIGNLKEMSGLDLAVSGASSDPLGFAQAMKIDTAAWPKNIGAASVDVKASGNLDALNVNATVNALNGSVTASGPVANPLSGLSVNNLDLRIKHSNLSEALKLLSIAAPEYGSLKKPIDLKMNLGIAGQSYTMKGISGNLSGTEVAGDARFDMGGAKPSLQGALKFGRLVLESVKGSGGGSSSAASAPKSGGKWSSAPMDSAWLHSMNADLDIAASSLLYEGWDMKSPSIKMMLKDGVATVSDLQAGLYDGQIGLKGTLSSATPKSPLSLDGAVSIAKVNMEPLVGSLFGNRIIKGQGEINMNTNVKGSGGSMAALMGSLAGQGSVNGSNIVIEGIDVTRFVRALSDVSKPGDSVLNLWKGVGNGGSTAFDTLDGAYVIENGIVTFQKMLLDGPRAAIDTTGSLNLPNWTINTEHKMSVKDRDDVPPFTVKMNGSLDNPAQSMGQGAINDYLQRKLQDKLGKVIGDKLGADNPLSGVLGGLLGAPAAKAPAAAPAPAPANDNAAPVEQQQQEEAPQEQAPAPAQEQQITPEDAVKGLLNEFLR